MRIITNQQVEVRGGRVATTTTSLVTVEETSTVEAEFNWLETLKLLAAGAKTDYNTRVYLTCLSRQWPTCACGTLCKRLPRDAIKAPLDSALFEYGVLFYRAVQSGAWIEALRIFQGIERRTAWLLERL